MSVPNEIDAREIDANDPLVLDRLVDGELTDAEERAVIAQLSQIPGGWRRCTLAFLEARCWQRAAQHVRDLSYPTKPSESDKLNEEAHVRRVAQHDHTPKPWESLRWPGAVALCALFLLAFVIGTMLPSPWNRSQQPTVAQPGASAAQPAVPSTLVDNVPPPPKVPDDLYAQDQRVNSNDLLLGNVKFVDNSGRQFDIPVYDWNEEVAEQLMYHSQSLPPEFFQRLKRHQVRSHQSYVPVKLQDGRQVVVPVQKLEIVPVGGTAY